MNHRRELNPRPPGWSATRTSRTTDREEHLPRSRKTTDVPQADRSTPVGPSNKALKLTAPLAAAVAWLERRLVRAIRRAPVPQLNAVFCGLR